MSATVGYDDSPAQKQFSVELKSDTLKGLVNIISALVDEVKFSITPEGMTLKAVDAAHVAMIEVKVDKGAFESYYAEDCEIGLDLDKVKGVLKLASGVDLMRMEQDPSTGRLVFRIGNITREMAVLDPSSFSDPKVPDLHLKASIGISVDELKRGISAADTISDHITMKASPERFELSCEGDTDSVSLSVEKSALVELSTDSEVCSMFPLDYFSNIIKAVPGGTVINIELDDDYPMKLLFGIADKHVSVNYLLAPRIESE
ncbi:MAG: DNA polymerase sliding clamp [Candidatus Methanomethylophilaceae archaeon]|jgi:proliferating cell nuclear antigen|nr:DNA polymerase sliding clamp [Candidatus Methanomethylophilaceae archaeon]